MARLLIKFTCAILSLTMFVAISPATGSDRKEKRLDLGAYKKEIDKWRAARAEEIKGENGWLALIGLFWLKQGENTFGSDPSNSIILPQDRAPRFAGAIWLNKGKLRLESRSDATIAYEGDAVRAIDLQTDADGKPTMLNLGSLTFFVIKRGEKFALRVRDKQQSARYSFRGISYFPLALKWKIQARFEAYNPPKLIPLVNVLGMSDEQKSPGAIVFEINGKPYRLDAIEEKGSKKLFIIFADKTNGKQSYGGGRYLYTDGPDARGNLVLDFNRAENPPCAFTNFATCPLPPRQNRLQVAIEAGERKYTAPGH